MTDQAKPDAFDAYAPIDPARALAPVVVRVNEKIVRRGFWPKLRRVASHIPFAEDVLAMWFCVRDPETPFRTKAVLLAALAYFVLPTDFLPDWLPGLGFSDDAAVIAAAIGLVGRSIQPQHREAALAVLDKLSD